MRKLLALLGGLFLFLLLSFFLRDKQIDVIFDKKINALPIERLKNLRYLGEQERKNLFGSLNFADQFNIKTVCKSLEKGSQNPHIILWYTDHFGRIRDSGFRWYKKEIFDRLAKIKPTFWLVDLSAWRYLSLKEAELSSCSDFREFKAKQNRGVNLTTQECPLIITSHSLVQECNLDIDYRVLQSYKFFEWLNKLPFSIKQMDSALTDKFVRKDLRKGAARFTLKNIGFCPYFLDQTVLECDHTQVFPLLQYLEGLYYASCIVDECIKSHAQTCDIVFLLPNKEFAYYVDAKESSLFATFSKNLPWLLRRMLPEAARVHVRLFFCPFAYGTDFYDQPYELKDNYV